MLRGATRTGREMARFVRSIGARAPSIGLSENAPAVAKNAPAIATRRCIVTRDWMASNLGNPPRAQSHVRGRQMNSLSTRRRGLDRGNPSRRWCGGQGMGRAGSRRWRTSCAQQKPGCVRRACGLLLSASPSEQGLCCAEVHIRSRPTSVLTLTHHTHRTLTRILL